MKIQVLGTGCPKCRKLYDEAGRALAAAGIPADLEKVEQIDDILEFGVMMTPALVVDGVVKCAGRIPSGAEIASWLAAAAAKNG